LRRIAWVCIAKPFKSLLTKYSYIVTLILAELVSLFHRMSNKI
jgi:hypothetical protein